MLTLLAGTLGWLTLMIFIWIQCFLMPSHRRHQRAIDEINKRVIESQIALEKRRQLAEVEGQIEKKTDRFASGKAKRESMLRVSLFEQPRNCEWCASHYDDPPLATCVHLLEAEATDVPEPVVSLWPEDTFWLDVMGIPIDTWCKAAVSCHGPDGYRFTQIGMDALTARRETGEFEPIDMAALLTMPASYIEHEDGSSVWRPDGPVSKGHEIPRPTTNDSPLHWEHWHRTHPEHAKVDRKISKAGYEHSYCQQCSHQWAYLQGSYDRYVADPREWGQKIEYHEDQMRKSYSVPPPIGDPYEHLQPSLRERQRMAKEMFASGLTPDSIKTLLGPLPGRPPVKTTPMPYEELAAKIRAKVPMSPDPGME